MRGCYMIAKVSDNEKSSEVFDVWSEDTKQDAFFFASIHLVEAKALCRKVGKGVIICQGGLNFWGAIMIKDTHFQYASYCTYL